MKQNSASFERWMALVALVVSVVSLVVAWVSLNISNSAYVMASSGYIPQIEFSVEDNGVSVVNQSSDLFTLRLLGALKIQNVGAVLNDSICFKVPFVAQSAQDDYFDDAPNSRSEYSINFAESSGCAEICAYNSAMVSYIKRDVNRREKLGKAWSPPLLNTCFYLLYIEYEDSFNNTKTLQFIYRHVHGHGAWRKRLLNESEWNELIDQSRVKEQGNVDHLWAYLLEEYECGNDDY